VERKPFQEHTLIKVGGRSVGLIGLAASLERVRRLNPEGRAEAERLLVAEVSRKNYIAPGAVAEYREALWREYCRHTGLPVAEEAGGRPLLSVCGASCPACERLEQELISVLAEEGLVAEVEHIRDPAELARLKVLSTPALLVDGRPVPGAASMGRAQLKALVRGLARR